MPENNSHEPLRAELHELLSSFHKFSSGAWRILRSFPLFYLALLIMAGYAGWDARTPVTMIAPFQMPKADLPFSGDIVADAVQDGLKSIRNEINEQRQDPALRSSETGLPDVKNMLVPKLRRIQAPPRFTVEVKGLSYERILSVARAVLGTESTVSGDVVLKGDQFILVARTADGGPWESAPNAIGAEGLEKASKDLAKKILLTQDPTLEGVALLEEGYGEEALEALSRARTLNPTDVRLRLNLCMGLAANRRYDEAIDCYNDVLAMDPSSPEEIREHLAQAYYLQGKHQEAINLYKDLADKGDRQALLELGEALDDSNDSKDSQAALNLYDQFLATEHQDRNRAIAHVKRGLALAHLGKHDEALREYQEALKYAPRDVLILVHKSLELATTAGLDTGIAELRSVVSENESSDAAPFAFLQLGSLLQQNGDWKGAIEQFRIAAKRQPNYVEAHQRLADALVHEGDPSGARHEYEALAKLSPYDMQRGYFKIFADQWLGNKLRDVGNYPAAASAYRDAIRLKPDYAAAHCQLGLILAKQGHVRDAVHEYGEALVPAKMKELDDSECTVMAQRQLVAMLASEVRGRTLASVAELRKSNQAISINKQPAAVNNPLVLAVDKRGLVEESIPPIGAQ